MPRHSWSLTSRPMAMPRSWRSRSRAPTSSTPSGGSSTGQQIVVDTRSGAAGNTASELVARSKKDGYTLLMGLSSALVVNPSLYADLGFDVERDFAPVSLLAEAQYILVVNPAVPARSVKELIDYAMAHPRKLKYSSTGVRSPLHLAAELFKAQTE